MAITDKKKGVWGLDQTFNKINQGSIWDYYEVFGLWTWGNGANQGFLGLNQQGSTPRRSSPTQVPGTSWDKLSGGKFFHATQVM